MGTFGSKQIGGAGGRNTTVFTNPENVLMKPGGVTIDWAASNHRVGDGVAALPDGTVIPNGVKYVRYGQSLAKIAASGKYGPVDTTANDGRQVVDGSNRGSAFLNSRTFLETDMHSDHQANVADNGEVFAARLLTTGTGAPTLANLRAMFPRITPID